MKLFEDLLKITQIIVEIWTNYVMYIMKGNYNVNSINNRFIIINTLELFMTYIMKAVSYNYNELQ